MLLTVLPVLACVGLTVFCLIECLQTPHADLGRLSRGWWCAAVVLLPIAGPAWWLLSRRTAGARHRRLPGHPDLMTPDEYPTSGRAAGPVPLGPDDDLDFIADLERAQRQRRRRQQRPD